jgi:hypothetical protein
MSGGGMGGGLGFSPRGMVDNWRAHPGQQAFSTGLGMLLPGAGTLANLGFRAYNNHQFTNAAQQANANGAAIGDQAAQQGMDRPLNGVLGSFDGMGQGGGMPTPGGQSWNYGQFAPQQNATPWTQQGNPGGLLDFLGNAPAPQQAQGGGFDDGIPRGPNGVPLGPEARRDAGWGGGIGGMHAGGPMGVTNFNVGGSPVINGSYNTGDPNQGYYRGPGGL